MFEWTPPSSNAEQAARYLISAATYMHTTFKDEIWLWRGQADRSFSLTPGMHGRVMNVKKLKNPDQIVNLATNHILSIARESNLDLQGGTRLPDLALLAHLQHYGAATPLLDVSTDPLIALWMAAFAGPDEPDRLDHVTGLLYGIRKPPPERWIPALDARKFYVEDESKHPSVVDSLRGQVWWYEAPDVTERLRIQRGSFLLGPLENTTKGPLTSLPLNEGFGSNWLEARLKKRGQTSNTARCTSDVFAIKVRGSLKEPLRKLLEDRSGLSIATVYPTPWNRPLIETFSRGYGRSRRLELDVNPSFIEDVENASTNSA
jgi:hypothetical protein